MRKSKDQSREEYEQQLRDRLSPCCRSGCKGLASSCSRPALPMAISPAGGMATPLWCLTPKTPPRAGRFELPRQRSGNTYCIADFYCDLSSDGHPTDVLPMQAVTMGETASAFAKEPSKPTATAIPLFPWSCRADG